VVIALSITLDLVQEHKAERTADALRQSVAVKTDVVRNGQSAQVPCEEVVRGDIVVLKAGDLVPADGIVLSGSTAHANETVLAGEPYGHHSDRSDCRCPWPAPQPSPSLRKGMRLPEQSLP